MKKLLTGALFALALVLGACSDEKAAPAGDTAGDGAAKEATARIENTNDPNVIKIAVPTMQCESCAKTISKAVAAVPAYQKVDVDVDNKSVFVKVSNNTADVKKELETAIAHAGYSTESVQRDAAAYDALPDCCKEGGH